MPVEVCKRKVLGEESITLSKGQVVRKEGEKRRTPSFRRGAAGNLRSYLFMEMENHALNHCSTYSHSTYYKGYHHFLFFTIQSLASLLNKRKVTVLL